MSLSFWCWSEWWGERVEVGEGRMGSRASNNPPNNFLPQILCHCPRSKPFHSISYCPPTSDIPSNSNALKSEKKVLKTTREWLAVAWTLERVSLPCWQRINSVWGEKRLKNRLTNFEFRQFFDALKMVTKIQISIKTIPNESKVLDSAAITFKQQRNQSRGKIERNWNHF